MMQDLIIQWGYLAVLLGTGLEGEAILLLAGVAAHDGYLRLDLVILCGFAGSVASDQAWFWVGRSFGRRWLARHPTKTAGIRRVTGLLDRWGTGYVLVFRFLYGLRTISPIAIGLSSIPALRFACLNIVAAALWSAIVSGLGYLSGEAISSFLHSMKPWQRGLVAGGIILLVVGCLFLLERRFLRGQVQPQGGPKRSSDEI
jgi:membrane protein DedA with SNARE-associated domain